MDAKQGLPEDLSSPGSRSTKLDDLNGKDRSVSPVSPPKFSPPASPVNDKEEGSGRSSPTPRKNGAGSSEDSPRTPNSNSSDLRPLALDLTPRSSAPPTSVAMAAAAAAAAGVPPPLSSLFPGFPGLLPPGPGGFPNHLLGPAGSPNALSQLNALANPAFNPLGLPFPGGAPNPAAAAAAAAAAGVRRKSKSLVL